MKKLLCLVVLLSTMSAMAAQNLKCEIRHMSNNGLNKSFEVTVDEENTFILVSKNDQILLIHGENNEIPEEMGNDFSILGIMNYPSSYSEDKEWLVIASLRLNDQQGNVETKRMIQFKRNEGIEFYAYEDDLVISCSP